MKTKFKDLKNLNLPIFFISDAQEWEVIEGKDFKTDDIVEYEINLNLFDEEYILITKKY